jgi:hypothetical protein
MQAEGEVSRPVSRVLCGGASLLPVMAIHLGRPLPGGSSNQPGRRPGNRPGGTGEPASHAPPLFGLAPSGVCPAAPVASGAVRSYRTLSPLPRTSRGGLLSVALSLRLPPPDVIRRCVSMEPGLSSAVKAAAAIRPTDPRGLRACRGACQVRVITAKTVEFLPRCGGILTNRY